MMNPLDYFRDRLSNIRAHPFQSIASGVAGGFVPGGGLIANNLFGRYNNHQFNNAAQQFQDRSADFANLNTNASLNDPLSDNRLSGDNAFGFDGPTGPNDGTDYNGPGGSNNNRQLAQALSGAGGGQNGGGMVGGMPNVAYNGPSMSGQQWMDRSGGYGNLMGQTLGVAPDRGQLVDSLLDPISMGAGLPGSGHMNPQARRDYRDGLAMNGVGQSANYGISPMQVGGQNVIFGTGDPNGRYRNRRDYGG